jgi:hypothetical protein
MAGPSHTLGSPWIPLATRVRFGSNHLFSVDISRKGCHTCLTFQSYRVQNGLPAIGHPNFAPERDVTPMMQPQSITPKKPLVIDMEKIREKFNILGDRNRNRRRDPPVHTVQQEFTNYCNYGTKQLCTMLYATMQL